MKVINVYLRKEKIDQEHGYVWVKFYVNSEKVNFSMKLYSTVKNWNEKTSRVSSGDKEFKDKNLIIDNILARINGVFVKFRLRNRRITRDGFMKMYNRPDDYDTFYQFCEKYRKDISTFTELSTLANHKKALKKLQEYEPALHFDDITHDFLTKYFNGQLLRELKNNHNTAFKDMSIIRKYVHAARRAGYMDENPFKDFPIKRTTASYTFLNEQELQRLLAIYRGGKLTPEFQKTIQLFLYMCFGSQHITDARNMTMEQFTENSFVYIRKKLENKKPMIVTVPMSDTLKEIVNDIAGYRKKGPLFSNLQADQTMNKNLKAICKMDSVKIETNISHKTGRHTFATYYLSKTKDLNALMQVMGHSDIRETLKYAHVMDHDKKENISCFNVFCERELIDSEPCSN